MKEFDFDELDRAVNSLMGDVKKPDETSSVTTPASMPEPSNPPEDTKPEPSAPEEVDTPPTPPSLSQEALPTRPSSPMLPARSGGRFMDVVHPSSDMKSPSPATPSLAAPSREGTSLKPLSETGETKTPRPIVDVMAPSLAPEVSEENDSPKPTDDEVKASDTEPVEPSSNEPWSSPFLPDTQVEKRPLGGSPPQTAPNGLSEAIAAELSKEQPAEEAEEVPAESSKPADDQPTELPKPAEASEPDEPGAAPEVSPSSTDERPRPETDTVAVPAELNNDLVAIESGQKSVSQEVTVSDSFEPASPTTSPAMPVALSTGSIPPQYDEQPSSGDANHTPIYDNEAAHQPLAHPAKRKKGWLLIMFIVIILALGAALGAAAYFLGLV